MHVPEQHAEQADDIFRSRWNNYKSNDKKYLVDEPGMQERIFKDFNSEDHTDFCRKCMYACMYVCMYVCM